MAILEKVNYPKDLKNLTLEELNTLCSEIRELIIDTVSKRGGHLASSLGAVELTVALYTVFDPPEDKFIWDVGHQAYAHKILTGRKEIFHTLRTYGGLSGFPKREESEYDIITTGHSSTSISAGLGLACARDLLKQKNKVIAVIGDGSLTAGLALEGINNAGHLKKNLIVILNDNEMSISENVGAISSYLSRILTGEFYTHLRQRIEKMLLSIPRVGPSLVKIAKRMEELSKGIITPGIIFEELGFKYIGPIDGHDIKTLMETFNNIKDWNGPILIHVYTKKGKGYKPAEEESEFFHGVPPFNKITGRVEKPHQKSYTDVFGETLTELAKEDEKIIAITAAMRSGTGLKLFSSSFPERFFDVGIAEQHAVTFAAGLAIAGFRPFVAIYSTFLQRSFDMIIHDVCLQNLPVVFAIDRAGLVGEDGPTHHGLFDISYLRLIPNLVVVSPSDSNELKAIIKSSLKWGVPTTIRYPRGPAEERQSYVPEYIEIGKGELINKGKDVAIIAVGTLVNEAIKASDILRTKGIEITVFNARFIKPLDIENIRKILLEHKIIFTLEENTIVGGFGSAILELASKLELTNRIKCIGLPDKFIEHGPVNYLREIYGLTSEKIALEIERAIKA
jgi:1-deoxy-D-xylulose-5-phosphate synthase